MRLSKLSGRKQWPVVKVLRSFFLGHRWKVLYFILLPFRCPFYLVLFFAEVKIFSFWPKTMDYSQAFLTEIEVIVCGPFTPCWKVL